MDIRQGGARETSRDLPGPIDFLLNDGWPEVVLDVLRPLTPALRPRAVVVTDNVGAMRGDYADHTAWIRLPDKGFVSLRVSFRTGTEVSVRTG
ncbi:hypothetical protein ACFXDH_50090 [Streptomyces sp. NPDC059467]|uniref:hypothetical protein n=1 Tax=Streptomyces sp. NPDC059467 TaxID=3346844 RepID=UPI0036A6C344